MATFSRRHNTIVGPQGTRFTPPVPTNPMQRRPHQQLLHPQPQRGSSAQQNQNSPHWVLYVNPQEPLCASAIQALAGVDPQYIWIQDVAALDPSQRPPWLIGVPTLVSVRDQLAHRGTQALQTLQRLLQALYEQSSGGSSGGVSSDVTPLQDIMTIDPPQQQQRYAAPARGAAGTALTPPQRLPPSVGGGAGVGDVDNLSGASGATGKDVVFSNVNDPLNGTFAAPGVDPRYDESNASITSSQIDSYSSRRKNYGANVPTI